MSQTMRMTLLAALPALLVAGCTSLGAEDRALLEQTRQAAQDAKLEAQKATDAANRAAASAGSAERNSAASATAAQRSSDEAKAAAERADRMFQRAQRKGAPRS